MAQGRAIEAQAPGVSRRGVAAGLLAAPLAASPLAAAAAALPLVGGPRQVLISYRCDAARRPAFRRYMAGEHLRRLGALKAQGALNEYQVLFNPYAELGAWDAMMVLDFKRFADTARWTEIERTSPGGLTPAGLALARPLQTYSVDLAWTATAPDPGPPADRVFYAIPYSYAALGTYKQYVDDYVIPQVTGWIAEGVLSRYRIYLNRYPVGDPWDSLFLYDYRNLEAFGRRDEVVARVRKPLEAIPAWQHLNEIKGALRTESENTIAELLGGG
ncbi:hypothetical protein [Phenylobacterium sp.]|jgi:hypothetical protein|uniref:hypothetical protein n=1 Tax=Phenylobacterium sp. TaxID=1871053 RepID=UPI002E31C371|nr:hypothetical protein [Phenylobacterium sp.]HEX3367450.1 hypothetical protein [Phenylobacterium sp.]